METKHLIILGSIFFAIVILIILLMSKKDEHQLNLKIVLKANGYIEKENFENKKNPQELCNDFEERAIVPMYEMYNNIMEKEYTDIPIKAFDCSKVKTQEDARNMIIPMINILYDPILKTLKKGPAGYNDLVAIFILYWTGLIGTFLPERDQLIDVKRNLENDSIESLKIKAKNTTDYTTPQEFIKYIVDSGKELPPTAMEIKNTATSQLTQEDMNSLKNNNNTDIDINTFAKMLLYLLSKRGNFSG